MLDVRQVCVLTSTWSFYQRCVFLRASEHLRLCPRERSPAEEAPAPTPTRRPCPLGTHAHSAPRSASVLYGACSLKFPSKVPGRWRPPHGHAEGPAGITKPPLAISPRRAKPWSLQTHSRSLQPGLPGSRPCLRRSSCGGLRTRRSDTHVETEQVNHARVTGMPALGVRRLLVCLQPGARVRAETLLRRLVT